MILSRFAASRPPEGLAGAPADLPWMGGTLGEAQAEAAGLAHMDWDPSVLGSASALPPSTSARLLLREDVAVSPHTLRALAARGAKDQRDLRWISGGQTGALLERTGFGDPGPLLVWLRPGGAVDLARVHGAAPVEIDPKERVFPAIAGDASGEGGFKLPIADRYLLPMGHWASALWGNLLGLGPTLWREILGANPLLALLRLGWAAMRAGSLDPWRVAQKALRRGRKLRVHPSAVVEASVLGDGVEIGAGAVVRGSVLGAGAIVEEQALVAFCTLGQGARVQRQAMVKYSVLGARTAVAGIMQLGVVDQDAVVKHGAVLMDMALGRPVSVSVRGALVDAPFGMLGVCVGAGTVVGAGVTVAPGRVLPPGLQVLPPSDGVLRAIPEGIEGRVEVSHGRLVAR